MCELQPDLCGGLVVRTLGPKWAQRWNEAKLRRGDLCGFENQEIPENLRTVISVKMFSRGPVNDTNDLVNLVGWCLDGWW